MRGVPRSGVWSERGVSPQSGVRSRERNRSERAQGRERLITEPPASRGPFLKRPCTERVDAPRPARRPAEAYPPRYGEGGQRSRRGCRGPRKPGSEGGREAGVAGWRRLRRGARKPISPQYKGRADTSTITASRIPIMYRMEAPNALRYLRRPTTLR